MEGVAVKLLVVSALVALLSAAGSARADNGTLVGDVGLGDAFTISLKDSTGTAVTHLNAGTYTLVVHDHSAIHNFDLSGPGVSAATDIAGVGDQTFTITLVDGTYFFQCDEHPTTMKGTFTVGAVTTPPPPTPAAPPTAAGRVDRTGGEDQPQALERPLGRQVPDQGQRPFCLGWFPARRPRAHALHEREVQGHRHLGGHAEGREVHVRQPAESEAAPHVHGF